MRMFVSSGGASCKPWRSCIALEVKHAAGWQEETFSVVAEATEEALEELLHVILPLLRLASGEQRDVSVQREHWPWVRDSSKVVLVALEMGILFSPRCTCKIERLRWCRLCVGYAAEGTEWLYGINPFQPVERWCWNENSTMAVT